MLKKGISVFISSIVLFAFLFVDLATASLIPIYRFKGTQLSVRLKIKDKVIEKGAYDLEFLRASSPVLYYIKIMKGGKILDIIQGEEWPYGTGIASDVAYDMKIPTSPTLKMTKNKSEKLMTFIFESGRNALDYPMIRARFKLSYEE
jgi:hypothetical protein